MQGWSLAVIWEFGFRAGSHHLQNWSEWLCTYCVCKRYGLRNTCFPLGVQKCWYLPGREGVLWPTHTKNCGHRVSNKISWQTTLHVCCHDSLLEELSTSCRRPWEACVWYPWTLSHEPSLLPCAPSMVVSLSCEYSHVLRSASPPSKSPSLNVVLGAPNMHLIIEYFLCAQALFSKLRRWQWAKHKYLPCGAYVLFGGGVNL